MQLNCSRYPSTSTKLDPNRNHIGYHFFLVSRFYLPILGAPLALIAGPLQYSAKRAFQTCNPTDFLSGLAGYHLLFVMRFCILNGHLEFIETEHEIVAAQPHPA
jgi:hypothetical protein